MLTNIIATLLVVVTTNTYAPKQYWHPTYIMTFPPQEGGDWRDSPVNPWNYQGLAEANKPKERDNPDVLVTDVREIKTLSFDFDGKTWTAEISNTVISTERKRRVVTSETIITNGVTITTTAERWANE